jgi:hypothetical protein
MFKTILITIINEFNWDKINGDYLRLFEKSISELKLYLRKSVIILLLVVLLLTIPLSYVINSIAMGLFFLNYNHIKKVNFRIDRRLVFCSSLFINDIFYYGVMISMARLELFQKNFRY